MANAAHRPAAAATCARYSAGYEGVVRCHSLALCWRALRLIGMHLHLSCTGQGPVMALPQPAICTLDISLRPSSLYSDTSLRALFSPCKGACTLLFMREWVKQSRFIAHSTSAAADCTAAAAAHGSHMCNPAACPSCSIPQAVLRGRTSTTHSTPSS